jgi:hypothetical protein
MDVIKLQINGSDTEQIKNLNDLSIKSDFADDRVENEVSVTEFEFVKDANKKIRDHANTLGVFQGLPASLLVRNRTQQFEAIKGYIDLADDAEWIGCDTIKAKFKKDYSRDWLEDIGESFSYKYLRSIGIIKASDEVNVPYVINYIPDSTEVVMLTIAIYMMSKELAEAVRSITEATADLIEATTPTVGVPPSVVLGAIIAASIKLAAAIAYSIAIVIAIKNLIQDLFNEIISPVRNHKGIKVHTMLQRACEYLGLEFRSSIFEDQSAQWKDMVYIPLKNKPGGVDPNEDGVPSNSSEMYNFGPSLSVFKEMFNGRVRVSTEGNTRVLRLERKDYWDSTATYVLPDVLTNQDLKLNAHKKNTSEMFSNYNILFQFDSQDQNTLDNFKGTNYQAIISPSVISDQSKSLVKNLKIINLPFSLATRKNKLTRVEEIAKGLGSIVDTVTGVFGSGTSFASSIGDRKGMMHLSSDRIAVPKLVIISGNKLQKPQRDFLSAKILFNNFHFLNSFVPLPDPVTGVLKHNQHIIVPVDKVKFCLDDFLLLSENNKFNLSTGSIGGEILSSNWKVPKNTSSLIYKLLDLYDTNLKISFNEPTTGGE